jgi:hypothetical protein
MDVDEALDADQALDNVDQALDNVDQALDDDGKPFLVSTVTSTALRYDTDLGLPNWLYALPQGTYRLAYDFSTLALTLRPPAGWFITDTRECA